MNRIDPRLLLIQVVITSLCIFSISSEIGVLCECFLLLSCLYFLKLWRDAVRFCTAFLLIAGCYHFGIVYSVPRVLEQILFLLHKLSPMMGVFLISLKGMSVSRLLAGLLGLHCPKPAALAVTVALRFIPTIQEELLQIGIAMNTRGIPIRVSSFFAHPVQMMEFVLVPFMMRCVRIADELAAAACTRAVEDPAPRGFRVPLKAGVKDYLYLTIVILILLQIILWENGLGVCL